MSKKQPRNPIPDHILEELFKHYENPSEMLGENGIFDQLKKRILERALEGELNHHLGYEKHAIEGNGSGNSRNGHSQKTVKSSTGDVELNIPRDRNGGFEPKIIGKYERRIDDLDKKIISLYSRGLSTRDIQEQLCELYGGAKVSAGLISTVTNEVLAEVHAWQRRELDKIYPIVYLDALMIKVREKSKVINKAFYLALGINTEGHKELLGIWISENEGAKFWLNVLTELKNRGVDDIFIACVDGLTGFPNAIEAVYPKTEVQLCIVHMVRNSLRYVGWKARKKVAADLREIYTSVDEKAAQEALSAFNDTWGNQYPAIVKNWEAHWENIIPFFQFPPEIRKIIYTTNAIESLNAGLRKVIKNKRSFPNDDAALKLLYLALRNLSKKWNMALHNWPEAMNQFSIIFEGRMP